MVNPVVEFNDSQVGVVLGSALHTLGAIAFLGGVVGYLAWRRHLVARGHHHGKVLAGATALTYTAIVANLLGGFMRTLQSDHPHLTEFATSGWVRAVAIKHVFIFAGMAAAIYLLERVAPRLLAEHRGGAIKDATPPSHRIGVLVVALGILLAAVLGALTQVVPPAAADAGDGMDGDGEMPPDASAEVRYENATGQLTTTPLAPTTSTGDFEVRPGTAVLEARFLWSPEQYALSIDLIEPDGGLEATLSDSDGAAEATVEEPAVGVWTYVVRADVAVNAEWTLSLRMAPAAANEVLMADTTTIAPGAFFEINAVAKVNHTLSWSWSTDGPVHFDIHTHFDDEVQYAVAEDGSGGSSGTYTVVRDGGHSYLWENTGTLPVTLRYRVWGPWEFGSVAP